jgi:hypothetical protein
MCGAKEQLLSQVSDRPEILPPCKGNKASHRCRRLIYGSYKEHGNFFKETITRHYRLIFFLDDVKKKFKKIVSFFIKGQ